MPARVVRLIAGCVLLGGGIALMVLARLGLSPWDVLHQGIAKHAGIQIGTAGILVGVVVLLAWFPLKQRFGAGTVVNVLLVGLTVDAVLAAADANALDGTAERWAGLLVGIVLFAAGTGLYVGAGLGPGPRDGLMTSLSKRHGKPIGGIRSAIELAVLAAGWLLGGRVGVGTLVFTVAIGPLVHFFLHRLSLPVPTLTPPSE